MMDAFTATLEACDPAPGKYRAYRIEAGTDLLSRSSNRSAHLGCHDLMLVIPLFSATCSLRSHPGNVVNFVGGPLFSIGPSFPGCFSRFCAVLGIAP
jgi:hypothetical protein